MSVAFIFYRPNRSNTNNTCKTLQTLSRNRQHGAAVAISEIQKGQGPQTHTHTYTKKPTRVRIERVRWRRQTPSDRLSGQMLGSTSSTVTEVQGQAVFILGFVSERYKALSSVSTPPPPHSHRRGLKALQIIKVWQDCNEPAHKHQLTTRCQCTTFRSLAKVSNLSARCKGPRQRGVNRWSRMDSEREEERQTGETSIHWAVRQKDVGALVTLERERENILPKKKMGQKPWVTHFFNLSWRVTATHPKASHP